MTEPAVEATVRAAARHRFPRRTPSAARCYAEWLGVATLLRGLELLPAPASRALLRALARLAYLLARSRTRRARENVRAVLGVDAARAREVVRGAYRTLFLNAVEPAHLEQALAQRPLEELVDVQGLERVRSFTDEGRGILFALSHFSAWECIPVASSRLLKPGWTVTRHLENERLSHWLVARRSHLIAGTLDKDGDARKLIRLLKEGAFIGPLLDQNAGHHGFLLDFLGQPCWQHRLPGVVAARFDVPVIPVYAIRGKNGSRMRLLFDDPILADPQLDGLEAELDVVRRLSASLERQVRAAPGEWLWLHDRWRRARKALADGTARAGEPIADMERAGEVRRETLRKKQARLGID